MVIEELIRQNVREMIPYSSARHDFRGEARIYLDANENPFDTGYNRYPDPFQTELKEDIGRLNSIDPDKIFLGNGSDEVIDLLIRVFCDPAKDSITTLPPTYGMYSVSAAINNITNVQIPLNQEFQPDFVGIMERNVPENKLLFLCSPNNPTGNLLDFEKVTKLIEGFSGIVVIDEAYIDFAEADSLIKLLPEFENLVVMQTFSKAWGHAAIRLGIAFCSPLIIHWLNTIKPPYNINKLTMEKAKEVLREKDLMRSRVRTLQYERNTLEWHLEDIKVVEKVYPSDANFLLVKVKDATALYQYLVERGIVVRDRSDLVLCDEGLRISVGTPNENQELIETLRQFEV